MSMDLSTRIMAHRYLYYVLARPVIDDFTYDAMEADAIKGLPMYHPLRQVGSDREADYSPEVKAAAMDLLEGRVS